MAQLLSGKEVAASCSAELSARAEELKRRGIEPTLEIIRIGEDPGDISYERGAVNRCGKIGIAVRSLVLEPEVTQEKLLAVIDEANADPGIHGVLLLRPLPKHLDSSLIENRLNPDKDADGMTDLSMSGIFTGRQTGYPPCTPEAVMKILDHYGIDCTGKRAVVIGRSLVFGKPAAMLLLQRNATVTVCHTRTADRPSVTREADILIAAAGQMKMIGSEHVREGQVVIDVGIHMGEDGKLCGDVDMDAAGPVVSAITPVPGGVGAVTTTVLAEHVIRAAEKAVRS